MQWILLLTLAFDLATIKSEPNLEKRSELALTNANTALDSARDAYNKGDLDRTETNLNEVLDSVDLAYQVALRHRQGSAQRQILQAGRAADSSAAAAPGGPG